MQEPQTPKALDARGLELTRLGAVDDAGLVLTSLPLPRGGSAELSLGDRSTYGHPLGHWHDVDLETSAPRRLLLAADGGHSPATLAVGAGHSTPATTPPTAEMELFETSPDEALMWERHRLRLRWQGRSLALALGLRTGDTGFGSTVHWWENCNLVVLEQTPFCTVVEMGGAIALEKEVRAYRAGDSFFANPLLHKHNWLNGHLFARLYANGVCELYAHHINARFFDDGLELADAVPVLGLLVDDATEAQVADLTGEWDGSRAALQLGEVAFHVATAARLATPEQPGRMDVEAGFLTWQPYLGMQLYGGAPTEARIGTPYVCRAEEHRIPRGMARTVRFSCSLNPERSPTIARYAAPPWWYGLCEELGPRPLLPVRNAYDATLDACVDWSKRYAHDGGFEDGSLPRGAGTTTQAPEPGWEGEIPYTLFLQAWRSGDAELYDLAMRSAYEYTDVAIDHAAKMTRMHAYPPPAFSVPMNRVQACVAAWLETGDGYLLNAARAVVDNAHWTHKNAWPRMVVGRDASYVRGAVYLYRYLGDRHYLDIARSGADDVCRSQRADGSFGDQAGGVGIHGEGAYLTKPWMGFMACGGGLDLLEMGLASDEVRTCVHRFADWLRDEQYEHDSGVRGWDYQHAFAGKPRVYNFQTEEWRPLKTGTGGLWSIDYLARFLTFCSLDRDDAWFFDAWVETYDTGPTARGSDHAVAQSLQYVTWVQDRLWNATLDADGDVIAEPVWLGPRTPSSGTVMTPAGEVFVRWEGDAVRSEGPVPIDSRPRRIDYVCRPA